jgi:hypothetical protein
MGRGAMTNRFRRPPGNVDVAVTSLEKRLSELEQLAAAQSRELRIQFERIAQLQAEWDIVQIRSSKSRIPVAARRRLQNAEPPRSAFVVRSTVLGSRQRRSVPAGSSPVTMRFGKSTASCTMSSVSFNRLRLT